ARHEGYRLGGHAHCQRNLHLHEREFQHRRVMNGKPEKDMVIYLSGDSQTQEQEALPSFDELTPREIVVELDKYIVGQQAAKKAVAIALRNRWRRMQVTDAMRHEIPPKKILMI